MTEQMIIAISLFILGAIVGSFLNVCIVRMPKEHSIVKPASHCVKCKHPLAWFDNIPLISFLLLAGKCRYCKAPFSFRYFLVELLTGITFVVFYLYFGLTPLLWPYLFMAGCFIVATFVDFEHRIIPDEISVGGMFAGFVFSFLVPSMHVSAGGPSGLVFHLQGLYHSILGALIGGGAIYAMGILGDFLFKKESMGGGDVKLLAMVGAFLGWKMAILTFFVAPFFGAVFGIIEKIRTKDSAIPYGPFLVLAALICLFKGQQLLSWVLSGYGLY
jgi:leader peptidase (prepilin peptidase)/N-methyltransferase